MIGNALRDGKVVKRPCEVCGDPKSQGHHEDYSKPLDVVWLCTVHHGARHSHLNTSKILGVDPLSVAEFITSQKAEDSTK